MARVDYDAEAERYQAGRQLSPDALSGWRDAISRFGPASSRPILDVGAGTGIWMRAFAQWFTFPVIGVEPSSGMRRTAIAQGPGPRTWLLAGRAEAIPLGPGTCSMAWLSTVIHHLDDRRSCASELRRVLEAGAPVMIRNSFPSRYEEIPLFRFFEAARRQANTWPRVEQIAEEFAAGGFHMIDLLRVREPPPRSLRATREWATRMRRTDSALAPLSDDEFAEGIARIDLAIADGEDPMPMGVDLMVLV
jgi:ubiquinone/menaquinone biosynthesis C-methylase UbiE